MLLAECERLANDYPDLAEMVESIDAQLCEMPSGAMVRPELFGQFLRADLNQVQSVFELLSEVGVLKIEEMIECGECQTLNSTIAHQQTIEERASSLCSNCESVLDEQESKTLISYRLQKSGIALAAASDASQKNNFTHRKEKEMKVSVDDVKRIIEKINSEEIQPGCKYMAVNRFTASGQENYHGAELFLGNCGDIPSGRLFAIAHEDYNLTIS